LTYFGFGNAERCFIGRHCDYLTTGFTMEFSTPRKLRIKFYTKSIFYNFDEAVLRRIVHNCYLTEKQRPTLKAIHSKMCESTGYGRGVTSLKLVLKKWDLFKFNSLNNCSF